MARLTNDSLNGGVVTLYCTLVYSTAQGEVIKDQAWLGVIGAPVPSVHALVTLRAPGSD